MADGVLVRHPDRIVAERRRARQDDTLRLVAREMAHDIGEVRRVKDLCARLYVLAHRLGDERQLRHRLEAHDLLVERLDEALLALLTADIAELRAAVAQVLLRLIAIEMLVALLEVDVEPRFRVLVVHIALDVDVDAAQSVVASASGLIIGDTSINISSVMVGIEDRLMEMELGPLFGLWFQSLFVGITMWALTICIFIITFGRMIEIYLVTSVAPIPMATMMGKEWGGMGQNYIRSLLALGFQAFLIIVCVAIYAVLVQNIALVDDIIYAIWTCMGYTVLLCFCLFKTSSLAKSVFNAH